MIGNIQYLKSVGRESSEQLLGLRMKIGGVLLETEKYSKGTTIARLPNPGKVLTIH